MQVPEANPSAETSFTAPFGVGCYDNFSALILVAVVDIKLELLSFVCLNQCKQIFTFVQNRVSANDVVAERTETGGFSR